MRQNIRNYSPISLMNMMNLLKIKILRLAQLNIRVNLINYLEQMMSNKQKLQIKN